MTLTVEPRWTTMIDDTTRLPIATIAPIHGDDALLTQRNRKQGQLWIIENRRSELMFPAEPTGFDFITKEGFNAAVARLTNVLTRRKAPSIRKIAMDLTVAWSAGDEEKALAGLLTISQLDLDKAHLVLSDMLVASGYSDHELVLR